MKRLAYLLALLSCLFLSGCAHTGERDGSIPFQEGQGYAVAHLGYQQTEDLDYYAGRYLDGGQLPVHYLSSGDFYLIVPRYPDTALELYRNDITTGDPALIFEDPDCGPFILQCNASDIFCDATLRLSHGEEVFEFSPSISLEDGSVLVGEGGLLLTREEGSGS